MKALTLATLLILPFLFQVSAEASQRAIEHINRALEITNTEMNAIYSGRYTHYRPETIRNIISSLIQEARPALDAADSQEGRSSLVAFIRSLDEEYSYSSRFQRYRLESTRLLILSYQRYLKLAKQSEIIHSDAGEYRPCNGNSRVYCGNEINFIN